MPDVFVDTSGWACWVLSKQNYHGQAVAALTSVWSTNHRAVTTSLVLAELTALVTRPLRVAKPDQIQLLRLIRNDRAIEVIDVDSILIGAAWSLWDARPDKEWSFVDCSSLEVMQRRGLTEALTTDHHFEQAGMIRLLR